MITTAIGLDGEQAATEYLVELGYEIVERNWRTKVCEIDIIAKKNMTLHFIEVKYRGHNSQGSGLDYITPRKVKRLWFAARVCTHAIGWRGAINIAAIEVNGSREITGFVPEITYDL